jgi:molecular chaperone DnaJ
MSGQADPYVVLGVERSWSQDDIKKAYRRLVREFHPDSNSDNPDATERFREIQEAYELIGRDEQRRREYDRSHRNPFTSFGQGGGDFSTLIRQPPSPGQRPRPPMKGKDIEADVEIEFDDALHGATPEVTVEVDEICADCEGDRTQKVTCTECGGSGLKTEEGEDDVPSTGICHSCKGEGTVSCNRCKGVGRIRETRRHRIKIPAGVDEGTRIRIPGKGSSGVAGGAAGDLYVTTHVRASSLYERNGANLILDVPITYPEAVLGCKVQLPTPDGPIELKVPERSQPGRMLRVSGRGVKVLGSLERGDLFARLVITLPRTPNDDEKDLLGMLLEVSSENPREHFFPASE